MIYGVDISSWQGYPDMARLRAEGHDWCVSKLTGEGNYQNPYCATNCANARKAGLIWGVYDWIEPQSGMTGAQAAEDYLRVRQAVCPPQTGDLLCVDYETPDWATGPLGRNIEGFMREYLYTLRDKSGQPVIVYSAKYFLEETGADGWDWLGRDFLYWQAAPGPQAQMADDSFWPASTAPFADTLIHQHQWHATSGAVAGEFDRNRFRGTREQLMAYGLPGAVSVPVTPQGAEVQEPASGKFTAYINDKKEAIFVANFGGEAEQIDGIAAVDLGLSVVNAAGEKYDRSIQSNVVQVWHDRRQDAGATKKLVGATPQKAEG